MSFSETFREVYLVRHGESLANVERRIQGWSGTGLSKHGREEARSAGQRLRALNVKRLVTSDLLRAVETASIIAEETGASIEEDEGLREIRVGPWEGRLLKDVESEDPEAIARWRVDARIPPHPEMESLDQLTERTLGAIRRALDRTEGSLAVISHGGAISALVTHILGLELLSLAQMPVFNASISLTLWNDDRILLGSYNETGHLPPRTAPGFNAL